MTATRLSAARVRLAASTAGALLIAATTALPALAHGDEVPPEPTLATFLFDWTFEPVVVAGLALAVFLELWLVRRVDRLHPDHPVPRGEIAATFGGLLAIAIALISGIGAYDTTLFSVHMIQHILLVFVAAPLLVLGAPMTLLLRASSHEVRVRWILPILESRPLRMLAHPVVAWCLFAGVMWGSHFSPLFDASLEDPGLHDLEHLLFLGSALLFWWPVVGRDPVPWRLAPPARILYLFLQMPQNSFLSVAILWATTPLYPHYLTLERSWGISVLSDQELAGALMWGLGDFAFLVAVLLAVAAWLRDDERRAARSEGKVDAERAAIREREARLAERLAAERAEAGSQSRSGAPR